MNNTLLLRQKEAARILGLSERTLEKWRWQGGGPPFVVLSQRCIRYSREDLERWIQSRVRRSTSHATER